MKKFISIAIIILFSFLAYSQEKEEVESESSHCYFKKNSISIGLAVPYSFELNAVGINARVYYNIGEAICFGPEFSYFNNGNEEVMDVNFVGHYIFETPWVGIFPLVGVNYTVEKGEHHNQEAIGVVFGAGVHRNFGKVAFFGEYAHVESDLRDDFITVGLFYNIR
ncbi:MAG: hypothetical protein OSB25_08660 [Salibacteraceae bacterium]|nr:hypothetical protein [Salibacteraceae bacterium]|tara:strand:- start:732 stop:1229 length:498 start_codon:yes stop_codon:yes gene_type:complete